MVGDINKLIYRFRLAEPSIFTALPASTDSDHCRLVNLSANFRCRTKVVTGVNELFSRVMSVTVGDVSTDLMPSWCMRGLPAPTGRFY